MKIYLLTHFFDVISFISTQIPHPCVCFTLSCDDYDTNVDEGYEYEQK